MPAPATDALDAQPLCRRTITRLADALPDELELRSLAVSRDQRRFANRVLAALHAGRHVGAEVLVEGASLLDDPMLLAVVVARVEGDVDAAVVGAMVDRRIRSAWSMAALLFVTACRLRQEGAKPSGELVRWVKWVARRADDDDALAATLATAELVDDPLLSALVAAYDSDAWRAVAQETADWLVSAYTGEVLSAVPVHPPAPPRQRKVGRNDKCPCGSGKKYKRCCEGKPLALAPQSEEELAATPIAELVQLDPERVPEPLRARVGLDLAQHGELKAAVAWADAVADDTAADRLRAHVAAVWVAQGDMENARELSERLPDDLVPIDLGVRLATPARGIKALEKIAARFLDDSPIDVALSALASPFPAVGIAVARSVLLDPELPLAERLQVLEGIGDRRDEVGWWPWDRGATWPLGEPVGDDGTDDRVQEHLAARRHAEAAYQRVERERARLEGEVARLGARLEAAPVRTVDEQRLARLEEELAAVKADHKRVHAERNALRRELREWAELAEQEAEEDEQAPDGDDDEPAGLDDEVDDEVLVAMGVRVPVLPDDFAAALTKVPTATQRATMQRLGELCSGRATGWRDTKRLRGFDNVWRVRIGRSYRLLYRVMDDTLEVLDLVHRQELEKKLHKLQALR